MRSDSTQRFQPAEMRIGILQKKTIDVQVSQRFGNDIGKGIAVQDCSIQFGTVSIPGSPDRVARYQRQGDDRILHMQDGTVVRYQRFFLIDAEGYHSELVFDDGTRLTHIHFSSGSGSKPTR